MKTSLLASVMVMLSFTLKAQTFTSSNLPIIIINTDIDPATSAPRPIPNEPKVSGTMKVIFRPDSSRNYVTDQDSAQFLNYIGRIGIEMRGSSSQLLPKKPYGLTTLKSDNTSNNNVSILGMPKENDWILNGLAYDPTLIRDYLSYQLYRDLGHYAARGVYCEVIVNGDYKGLYILMEKLKADEERINIVKLSATDTAGVKVTGGYITKTDKTEGGDPIAWTMPKYTFGSANFIHESPKPADITAHQNTYIRGQFTNLQNLITNDNASIVNGYPSVIDIPTFVDFMILCELSSNADAYEFSTFFHKDKNGKLRAGPIWDFNLTYGNDLFHWNLDRSRTNVWQFNNSDNTGPRFWRDLFDDEDFKCHLAKRWKEVTAPGQPLNLAEINAKIDQLLPVISEAMERENVRWNTLGDNYTSNISTMKRWLSARIVWLNTNLANAGDCLDPSLPPLVISKIHYHPVPYMGIEGNDLEFIEITNNGNLVVDLTGIYFRELGMSYQFPANSSIGPNEKIYLASKASTFEQAYGHAPFGEYTRNLSNKSFNLVLADAFGNIIDQVQYMDNAPWPVQADGTGPYLQLNDVDLDNSLASNWVPESMILGTNPGVIKQNTITVYPNPTQGSVSVRSNTSLISSYEIMDMVGVTLLSGSNISSGKHNIHLGGLQPNTYLLKVNKEDGSYSVTKIIKF